MAKATTSYSGIDAIDQLLTEDGESILDENSEFILLEGTKVATSHTAIPKSTTTYTEG